MKCDSCNRNTGRIITCVSCNTAMHPECLGLGRHAYPADTFTCATCVLIDAKVTMVSAKAADVAHRLVWLRGMRVQESSQNTYASGLHRYVKFGQTVCNKSAQAMLPPGDAGIDQHTLEMFITWAAGKYKYNTITSTMSALVDWHKSKGIEYPAITCKRTKDLLATIKAEQGPEGLPAGKQGLTKAMLKLLLVHLHRHSKQTPDMAHIYLRDKCAFLLGFYGMLRRSEIASLALEDITTGTTGGRPFVELYIKKSKTDRGRVGASVTIAGVTSDGIDIIGPLLRYIKQRAKHAPSQTSPLFTSWDLDSKTCTAATPLSGQALAIRLRQYLETIKAKHPSIEVNPSSYGMHSLRRGGVIAAWEAGVDVEKIKSHGRWRSDAVRAYMQATRAIRLQVTCHM